MEKLLDKIGSYNLFNYLLPGIIFSILLEKTTSYTITQKDVIVQAFFAYFIGLIISRISSLFVEPILKKLNFVKFSDYKDFILASKDDPKIELLSEANNMYRVFISLFFVLILINIYELVAKLIFPSLTNYTLHLVIIILFVIFVFSYRKQTNYIIQRVEIYKNKQTNQGDNNE